MNISAKDLSKEPAASPRQRTGGYAILARMTDKARADINGTIGEYHTDCPLDHILLDWKDVPYAGLRKALEEGADDAAIAKHLDAHGTPKTPDEVKAWSDQTEKYSMHGDPKKGDFFDGECKRLGLDPTKASLFDMLEADDRDTFKKG